MERYICIHGHFYQPPRENPWLEEVELQDSAYPYHDWNQRITAECYAPNAMSRMLGPDRTVAAIVNNYARISFNFGPTLLAWMERHEAKVYEAIREADRVSRKTFSGHGAALAQVFNHLIMPLANDRDKRTQVIWGIRDFERRFERSPEGMWLAETAADTATLEVLAEHGILFTILSPHQARRVRRIGDAAWTEVGGGKIDPHMPYRVSLPSGRSIAVFFYDGPISRDVAFGGLLANGEDFAARLMKGFDPHGQADQLVSIATDGETFGHHHTFGDMTLSYALNHIQTHNLARITIYGEYLEAHPPTHEVQIHENSSWSCAHGIERWRSDCGCSSGTKPGWHQAWRAPLKGAMDWLRDSLAAVYAERAAAHVGDPWALRDAYIDCMLDRSRENVERFFAQHAPNARRADDRVGVLKLLEMQRHALLMFTSCGWFFDDISGIEAVQVMLYASRAMQLAREIAGVDLEPSYVDLLARARSNLPDIRDGAAVYEEQVKNEVLDFLRVGAHYAIASLFEEAPEHTRMYSYDAHSEAYERFEMGRQRLAVGRALLRSEITHEQCHIAFTVLHLGDHNLLGGVRHDGDGAFESIRDDIKAAFLRSDVPEVISMLDRHFGTHSYSLWHLFKDEQRKVMGDILEPLVEGAAGHFRQIYELNYPLMQAMSEMRMPLPTLFAKVVEYVLNADLRAGLSEEPTDHDKIRGLAAEARRWKAPLDTGKLTIVATDLLAGRLDRLADDAMNTSIVKDIASLLDALATLPMSLDLWKAQNMYYSIRERFRDEIQRKAHAGDVAARGWLDAFAELGAKLGMGEGAR